MFRRALHQECSRGDTIRGKRWQLMTPCNPGVLLPWKSEVRCEKGGAMMREYRLSSLCLLGSLLGHGRMGGWVAGDSSEVVGWFTAQRSACVLSWSKQGLPSENTGFLFWATVEIVVRFMCLGECWQGPWGISGGRWRNNNALNRAPTGLIQ